LQHDCTPQRLADALVLLLTSSVERSRQIGAFARLDRIMAVDGTPSASAAAVVVKIARDGRRVAPATVPRS
jgi:lipid-A-disaccharide synthase